MYRLTYLFLILCISVCFADLQQKIDSLKQELEKNPDNYKLHFDLGICYNSINDYKNAIEAFQNAIRLKPDYALADYKLALVYYEMDSLIAAEQLLRKIKTKFSDKPVVSWLLGKIYLHLEDYEKAIAFFKEHTRQQKIPEYEVLAMPYSLAGQYSEAIKYYQKSLKYHTYNYDLDFILSMLHYKTGDTISGEKWFKKAKEDLSRSYRYYGYQIKPEVILSYESVWQFRIGNFDRAIVAVETLITKEWDDGIDLYNLGIYKILKGDTTGLLTIKHACTRDTTGFVEIMYNVLEKVRRGDYTEAERLLFRKNLYLSRSGIANGLHAFVLEKQGKSSSAMKYWLNCFGKLPLGVDIESMRKFIEIFVDKLEATQPMRSQE
ncbi:MAG: tetratricopeptide repeat protein [candidate division WOR-3 bacterium]